MSKQRFAVEYTCYIPTLSSHTNNTNIFVRYVVFVVNDVNWNTHLWGSHKSKLKRNTDYILHNFDFNTFLANKYIYQDLWQHFSDSILFHLSHIYRHFVCSRYHMFRLPVCTWLKQLKYYLVARRNVIRIIENSNRKRNYYFFAKNVNYLLYKICTLQYLFTAHSLLCNNIFS